MNEQSILDAFDSIKSEEALEKIKKFLTAFDKLSQELDRTKREMKYSNESYTSKQVDIQSLLL